MTRLHENPEIDALLQGMNHASLPGVDLSLARMVQLLAALGNPEKKLPPVIHIAGTNGKGSTQAFLRAIYTAAGYRVHAYTSPHLVRFNERILLAGQEITDAQLLPLAKRVAHALESISATFFEATTAVAFLAFSETPADVLLLEVGLGGRLDATNMVESPLATVITPLGMDHMEFLGPTLADIAREKAGIMKPHVPCIVAPQQPEAMAVIADIARQMQAPLHEAKILPDLPQSSLAGVHQRQNAALASAVVKVCSRGLPVDDAALHAGIQNATWPARLQKLTSGPLVEAWGERGEVILDGGHNVHAAEALALWAAAQKNEVVLLAGMMARKNAQAFFTPLLPHVRTLLTVPVTDVPDGYDPIALAQAARAAGAGAVSACHSIQEVRAVLASEAKATLLIVGSLFLAGEILKTHG